MEAVPEEQEVFWQTLAVQVVVMEVGPDRVSQYPATELAVSVPHEVV